jgi:hypothetical protein
MVMAIRLNFGISISKSRSEIFYIIQNIVTGFLRRIIRQIILLLVAKLPERFG